MNFVIEYVFYKTNIEDVDEIIVEAISDCSYRIINPYGPLCLIFNVKIIDERDNKTKNKVFKSLSIGRIFLCRMRKKGYKVIKIKKITLRYCGIIDGLNICYRLKLRLPILPLEIAFYKNTATNDDYMNIYCVPIQFVFTEKFIKWYFYNKAEDWREHEELRIKYIR